MDIVTLIKSAMTAYNANNDLNVFDHIEQSIESWYNRPVRNLQDLKDRCNKKIVGDVFEDLAVLYFKTLRNKKTNQKMFYNVCKLADVPAEVLTKLNLKTKDYGIDIILQDYTGAFSCVQVKFRKTHNRNKLTWKSLSTFYALATRTGPYHRYIVFTNCKSVNHVHGKSDKDWSICIGSLRGIEYFQWLDMINQGIIFKESSALPEYKDLIQKLKPDITELRELRLKRFENQKPLA